MEHDPLDLLQGMLADRDLPSTDELRARAREDEAASNTPGSRQARRT